MFSQQFLTCSLHSMKKKVHNLHFANNDLFLFRIVGKRCLSISEEYLFYFSSDMAKSKRHIGKEIKHSVSVPILRTGALCYM